MTAKTTGERKKEERERRQQEGLKRVELWAHPDDIPAIQAEAAKRARIRARKEKR